MKRNRLMIALLTSVMLIFISWTVFAEEGDDLTDNGTGGTTGVEGSLNDEEQVAGELTEGESVDEPVVSASAADPTAKRTILLYLCGSDLETDGGMAAHNLNQILGSNFSSNEDSSNEDVNFIVMTGGAWRWQLDNDDDPENTNKYLVFPKAVKVPKNAVLIPNPDKPSEVKEADNEKGSISGVYNQVWEARGADAKIEGQDDPNAGKLVCLDGDGLTGTAITADKELMSDPKTLKAFINYGVANYPAEKYDLILWDHAGGPAGGFAMDQHFDRQAEGADLRDGFMSFSEIIDALDDNDVTNNSMKFDFIDFDACLMNSVELNLALADYTDYYIASAETEPGYGQDYRGWLDMVGETPDKNAFELGKRIVDDFNAFYEEGDGKGQDGTLAVVDLKKLMDSDFIKYLSEMTGLMKQEAQDLEFFDEFSSALNSIRYGQSLNYFDLGNFASTISVVNMEMTANDTDPDKIKTDNVYYDENITQNINNILQNEDIIYAKGTGGITKREIRHRRSDGEITLDPIHTSGMYIFFSTPDIMEKTNVLQSYHEEVGKVVKQMQNQEARTFLNNYMDVMADYALITATGTAVNWLINEENVAREDISYNKVKEYWTNGNVDNPSEYSDWSWKIKDIFDMRSAGEDAAAKTWLDKIARLQAEEVLSLDNISAQKVKTKEGTAYKVNIKGTKARDISTVQREIGLDFPAADAAINDALEDGEINEPTADMIRRSIGYSAGSVQGHITDDDIDMQSSSAEEIIRWYNRDETDWEVDTPDNCWYAVKDGDGVYHAAAIHEEAPDAYYVSANILMDNDQKVPLYLKFKKGGDSAHLTELIFNTAEGFRPIRVSDLTSTYDVQLNMIVTVREIWGKPTYPLPTTKKPFKLNKDSDITLEYTDIDNMSSDLGDTDGDGEIYHSNFTVVDIYGSYCNITDIINKADTVTSIDLTDVRPAVYTGEKRTPKLVYLGETLKEGVDYTWEFSGEESHLIEEGQYNLKFKGIGKFTGYMIRVFKIIPTEEEAKELVANAEKQVQTAEDALAEAQESGDQAKITEAYANLVNAQNNLTDAQKVLATTLDTLKAEQKDELENKIDELNDQIADLNDELAKAQVVDISHYAVTMSSSAVYNGKTIAPKVTVSGLKSTVYKVTYSNNKNVGTAKVVIEAKDPAYKGKINKTFKIIPKKAAIAKIKKGKKKMTVTAKTKVGATGGKTYQIRYKMKGKSKWKTLNTTKKKVTIKKLKKGKKYNVQIRAIAKVGGKTYYGAWSKVKTSKKIK